MINASYDSVFVMLHNLHSVLRQLVQLLILWSHLRECRPRLSANVQILVILRHAYGILTAVVAIRRDAYGIRGDSCAVAAILGWPANVLKCSKHSYGIRGFKLIRRQSYGILTAFLLSRTDSY